LVGENVVWALLMLLLWVLVVLRLELGVGRGGRNIVGISLTRHWLRARVDDDYMALFEVLD